MKKILFVTGNASKAKRFSEGLLEEGIEVLTLQDVDIDVEIVEDGKDAIENAVLKARACYGKVDMAVMGMDDSLYMEGVPSNKQPGLYVRRIQGKTFSDEEMLEYYTGLVREYGIDGKIDCKWVYGLAVIDMDGIEHTYTWSKDNFYMVAERSSKIHPGYPLNSISKYKKIDQYFTDVTAEELMEIHQDESDVVEFIAKSVGIY